MLNNCLNGWHITHSAEETATCRYLGEKRPYKMRPYQMTQVIGTNRMGANEYSDLEDVKLSVALSMEFILLIMST